MTTTQLPLDPATVLARAVDDFEGHTDPDLGHLTNIALVDHTHIYRGALGVHVLFAVAVPDPNLSARIVVTDTCPVCAPPRREQEPSRRYTVEYEIGW